MGVVPLKCFRCILEEQSVLYRCSSDLSQEPHLLACGPGCQPKTLHASQGVWGGFKSCQLSPLPLPMNLSLNPHPPLSSQRLPLESWRAFQRGIMNQTLSRCLSLFLQPWVSPEDRESFVLHGVPLQKGACEQSILPLGTTPHGFFFHLSS